jgi:hypothetical protein
VATPKEYPTTPPKFVETEAGSVLKVRFGGTDACGEDDTAGEDDSAGEDENEGEDDDVGEDEDEGDVELSPLKGSPFSAGCEMNPLLKAVAMPWFQTTAIF